MSLIIVPKHKDLWLPLSARTGVKGRFKLEAVDKFSGKKRFLAEFDNLITTNGANALGASSVNAFTTCAVGSGNAAPALTDTALQTLVASTTSLNSSGTSNSGSAPWFSTSTFQFNFPAGTATGNLSEIGVGATTTSLFSRALILDGGGSPTTITVLSTEALYATYQISQYVPTTDVTGTVVIAGVTYSYTLRGAQASSAGYWSLGNGQLGGVFNTSILNVVAYNGAIGAVTGLPTGSQSSASSAVNNSYSSGSFTVSGTATWNLTSGNLSGGISAVFFTSGGNGATSASAGAYQVGISPSIPKDGSHVLTLSFSRSWQINTP